MPLYTFLVKSEKNYKFCLAFLDENKKWVRPIKLDDGFLETEVTTEDGKSLEIFDVVDVTFGSPFPINHSIENMKFTVGSKISFVKKLTNAEKAELLKEISDPQLLSNVETKVELFDKIISLGRSIVVVGPIGSFDIQYTGNRPRFWITGKNNREIDIPCTDHKFCTFAKNKLADFQNSILRFNSSNIPELQGKLIYLVIGLTGDHLDENGKIITGKYARAGTSMTPQYWPLVVSVLTVPDYL